ncbi:hypothetical protein AMATHDRAFT_61735 [Amanita thiersii Skay4041]|uniref:Cytochrome b-c1 complex subunit 2, mitochondrial n=1 Tax=Amanita thiersii Skay4041 TaxID=703135 RepID=A0A2A9NPA9_9AGAR|nr:hypothetical protein AMATHDRAFT_61735 [Amanita thiersii Skay4041]
MLPARASTLRNFHRVARSFATVADTAGVRVASVDHGQPTSSVTILVKAGSRFQPKAGLAHSLKNFAFKSTAKRSALGIVRESELYGGVLSSNLTREHLALTAEFMRGDEQFFVDVLSSFITSAKYTRHEYEEYVRPLVKAEAEAAVFDPSTQAIEHAHALAFRSGLGSSLFAPTHNTITVEDIKLYATSVFTKDNLVVLGTGIDQTTLSKLVERAFASTSSATSSSQASKYYGGETRVESLSSPQTVFIGFGTTGAPSADVAALAAHLSPTPSVKWSQGTSPIAASIPKDSSVQTIHLPYSDATLFGLLVQGATPASVKEAGKVAVQALKSATSGIKAEELQRAVAKAKFSTATNLDGRFGLVSVLGPKILGGADASVETSLSSFNGVSASSVSKTASTMLSGKPTFVAVGEIGSLPHADELGL